MARRRAEGAPDIRGARARALKSQGMSDADITGDAVRRGIVFQRVPIADENGRITGETYATTEMMERMEREGQVERVPVIKRKKPR